MPKQKKLKLKRQQHHDHDDHSCVAPSSTSTVSSCSRPSHFRHWQRIPHLVVFDLDFTIWHPEMYELAGSPFKKNTSTGQVTDRRGEQVHFFPAVNEIFSVLQLDPQFQQTEAAVASSTEYPQWARECMRLMDVRLQDKSKKALRSMIDYETIYPRNKRVHFQQLKQQSGIEYDEMLFFDNEYGNISNVQKLGVTCAYCPNGLTDECWIKGMQKFQEGSDKSSSSSISSSSSSSVAATTTYEWDDSDY